VCSGQGTSCLAAFQIICEATTTGGVTLEQISTSVTVIAELQSLITTVLGIPTSWIQNIEVSLQNSTISRRLLQSSHLEISVVLYQDTATQPLANMDILSIMQLAVEQATFSEMNVTTIVGGDARYTALCGNGICETNEAIQGHKLACAQDCSSTQECPRTPDDALVGEPGAECSGRGTCTIQAGVEATCSCAKGHHGELSIAEAELLLYWHLNLAAKLLLLAGPTCSECDYGFVPRGSPATCTPTRSTFQELDGPEEGPGTQLRRTLLIIGVVTAVLLISGMAITIWCWCKRGDGNNSMQAASTDINDSLQGSSKLSWAVQQF
jgi:hypothetical protein